MIKPSSLRSALTAACPWLQRNPENLHVFVEDGTLRCTQSGGLSSEYNYTLTLLVTDYADNPDLLMIPIVAWLRWQQPDMLENFDKQKKNFSFSVDYLDNEKCDIEIKLAELTERVLVTRSLSPEETPEGLRGRGAVANITHLPEPDVDPTWWVEHWSFWIKGVPESHREWDTCPFEPPFSEDRGQRTERPSTFVISSLSSEGASHATTET
jgi:hypothetical protein